jgi:hypothetical protein
LLANGLGFIAVIWAYSIGFIHKVFDRDPVGFCYVIIALFAIGLISSCIRAYKVSKAKNELIEGKPVDKLKAFKMPAKNLHLYRISEYLAVLGLIGNILGFFIMLNSAAGADTAQLAQSIIAGLGVAFGATLVGSVTGLWLWINFSMIETATSTYLEDVKHING